MPLADKYRPNTIDDIVGQSHIIGEGKIINNMLEKGYFPNMIFFGPPGVGKTTVAEIIARNSSKLFHKINATNSSLEDIKKVAAKIGTLGAEKGILLYIDEIQSFNKKQQQSILDFIEKGDITLIASTTENPYHYVYKAVLSRSIIVEFKPLSEKDLIRGLENTVRKYNDENMLVINAKEDVLKSIAAISNGDMRYAINILELSINNSKLDSDGSISIDMDTLKGLGISDSYNFDMDGDEHYNLLSAFQKSIRGSDPDAAVYYLARLIKGGDLISICRRLLVIACEDIGLAYPGAISIVKSCVDSAMQLGLPEARIILSHAAILLASSPKSNSSYMAVNEAMEVINSGVQGDIPSYLKDSHYAGADRLNHGTGYRYPHDYPNNYVSQEYLPENLRGMKFYRPQDNKFEKNIESFLKALKKQNL